MKSIDEDRITVLRELLVEQYDNFSAADTGTIRKSAIDFAVSQRDSSHALVLSGLRRCGKSTLLAQIANQLYSANEYYYVNFDDERFLDFRASDFQILLELLIELFGERKVFFFDEIQNVERWETFARKLIDKKNKLYITGSNAELLSRELGTRLTGRHLSYELLPFSFSEFLDFNDVSYSVSRGQLDIKSKAVLKKNLQDYMQLGGVPEALKYPELPILKRLYQDALFRDIVARFNIDSDRALRELSYYLLSNAASLVSFNKLKVRMGLGSVNTIKNYIQYLENAWLLFTVHRYSYSVKSQQIAPKKIYAIDLGLCNQVGFRFSADRGRQLENLVYLELRRAHEEIYYYKTQSDFEVDFYVHETQQIVQVSFDIASEETKLREFRALEEAMDEFEIDDCWLITYDSKQDVKLGDKLIRVRPIYEFLLDI